MGDNAQPGNFLRRETGEVVVGDAVDGGKISAVFAQPTQAFAVSAAEADAGEEMAVARGGSGAPKSKTGLTDRPDPFSTCVPTGAGEAIRTPDPHLGKVMLYP